MRATTWHLFSSTTWGTSLTLRITFSAACCVSSSHRLPIAPRRAARRHVISITTRRPWAWAYGIARRSVPCVSIWVMRSIPLAILFRKRTRHRRSVVSTSFSALDRLSDETAFAAYVNRDSSHGGSHSAGQCRRRPGRRRRQRQSTTNPAQRLGRRCPLRGFYATEKSSAGERRRSFAGATALNRSSADQGADGR